MIPVADALRPSARDVLDAWAARVRANREQVEQYREASPADFYGPIAGMWRADPRRASEPTLEVLRALVQPSDVVLDIGAGGGRIAMPLALVTREVIAIDSSPGMLRVLREGMAEYDIPNVRVVEGRWPLAGDGVQADVALISHVGYDIEEIGPFLDAMEASASRLRIAVLLDRPPPSEADRLWPRIHGVERSSLPSLREFLVVLLARGRLPSVQLIGRQPQSYESLDTLFAWLRGQLWTAPDGPKDRLLRQLLAEQAAQRDGRYALNWEPQQVGIVTW